MACSGCAKRKAAILAAAKWVKAKVLPVPSPQHIVTPGGYPPIPGPLPPPPAAPPPKK